MTVSAVHQLHDENLMTFEPERNAEGFIWPAINFMKSFVRAKSIPFNNAHLNLTSAFNQIEMRAGQLLRSPRGPEPADEWVHWSRLLTYNEL